MSCREGKLKISGKIKVAQRWKQEVAQRKFCLSRHIDG